MRLDFNVLWVEDQQNNVESQRDRINLLISRHGFRLNVEFASSVEEAKGYLSNDIFGDHIDLILMDYDLGAGGKGDTGLEEVRKIFPYKDIIFYSAQAPDLAKMVAEKQVEGVFCSRRNDLPDTVEGVFEALVKKVLDIDHSRGIVMGATSDIDHIINECLILSFNNSDGSAQDKAFKEIEKLIKKKTKKFGKSIEAVRALKGIEELQQHHHIYTSADRLDLLRNILKYINYDADTISEIANYLYSVIPSRNDLAHVKVVIDGFSRKLYGRDDKELTSEDMKRLRHDLLKHQDLFETLRHQLLESSQKPDSP
ncbi:response regulator [Hahella ganghwensis]|uniref:response regulator n=1 Tax=Hahella ganghwensis TaxID=286420 RepID=UPI000377AB6C|nr:response regulator [Hahella ganghwensis]